VKNDGGPVYPHLHESCQRLNETEMYSGMTMRQWYKGMALDASLHNRSILKRIAYQEGIDPGPSVARFCAEVADAMIAEDEEAAK
jgi:hypothetical protein